MFINPIPAEDLPPSLERFTKVSDPDRPGLADGDGIFVRLLANSPLAEQFVPYYEDLWLRNSLGLRTSELVRLAIATTTGCPSCLATRVPAVMKDDLTESEIGFIRQLEDGDFSPAERAAIRFALNFGGDHHAIDAEQWAELHTYYTERQVTEIAMFCASFLGMSRLAKALTVEPASCPMPGHELDALAGASS
jgi:alkylhydroperoxidase family enzyme